MERLDGLTPPPRNFDGRCTHRYPDEEHSSALRKLPCGRDIQPIDEARVFVKKHSLSETHLRTVFCSDFAASGVGLSRQSGSSSSSLSEPPWKLSPSQSRSLWLSSRMKEMKSSLPIFVCNSWFAATSLSINFSSRSNQCRL